MQTLTVSVSALALALCAGCAMDGSRTSAMGAGSSATASSDRTLYCKDGAYMSKSTGCPAGLERDMTPAAGTSK